VHSNLEQQGVKVHKAFVGEYATSLEMAGASITILKLDVELQALLDHPAHTPMFRV
jgi:phosphoenolpyruvate---glycerone phosphotransferase subunit DhaK